jgi:hypothetical protein
MDESIRATARELANQYLVKGDALGWFEELYKRAKDDAAVVPWADLRPNPNLVAWLNDHSTNGAGKRRSKLDAAWEMMRRSLLCAVLIQQPSIYPRQP